MKQQEFVDLYTPEGEALSQQPWQSYPRPQMRRESWFNLNSTWDFAVTPDSELPQQYPEQIRVPFPPQSLLSGIHRDIPEDQYLFYKKVFSLPKDFQTGRVLLHIGAADQIASVWLNGVHLGEHTGGYDPFSFDVTHALREENTLVIRVSDQMSRCILPSGKQRTKRGGMWYTPVSGIWQTVWLERVPERYIRGVHIRTEENRAELTVDGEVPDGTVCIQTPHGELQVPLVQNKAVIELDAPRWWSPEDPFLYHCTIRAGEDQVQT